MAKKKENKVYSNDPQSSRYQNPRRVLDASIEKNRRKADHYRMREVNPKAEGDPSTPFPSDPTKDEETKRLFDTLTRQKKLYKRYLKDNEEEA